MCLLTKQRLGDVMSNWANDFVLYIEWHCALSSRADSKNCLAFYILAVLVWTGMGCINHSHNSHYLKKLPWLVMNVVLFHHDRHCHFVKSHEKNFLSLLYSGYAGLYRPVTSLPILNKKKELLQEGCLFFEKSILFCIDRHCALCCFVKSHG